MAIKAYTLQDIACFSITHETDIVPSEPVITIDGSIFAIKGGVSMVTGKTGSGKTTVLRTILTQALCDHNKSFSFDTLNIHVQPADGRPVIFLNTEMPNASLKHKVHDAVLWDLGVDETPENFIVVQAISHSFEERRQIIRDLFQLYPDMFMLVIDGGADTVPSVNDEIKSVEAIEELNKLANEFNTTVINVVHENKGNGLTRGHYGQHCERKSTGVISVRFDSSRRCFIISATKIRESAPFSAIEFEFAPNGRICQLSPATAIQRKLEAKTDDLLCLVIDCFKDESGHTIKERALVAKIMGVGKLKETTARRRKEEMYERNMIALVNGNYKCLIPIEIEAEAA